MPHIRYLHAVSGGAHVEDLLRQVGVLLYEHSHGSGASIITARPLIMHRFSPAVAMQDCQDDVTGNLKTVVTFTVFPLLLQ